MKGYSIKSSDWESIYPIGSIYMSANSTSPATLFGGTWTQLKDQFLLCAGSTYSAGSTGGSASINLSHTHSTGNHALTVNEMPHHAHTATIYSVAAGGYDASSARLTYKDNANTAWISEGGVWIDGIGGGAAHNHGNTGSNLSSSQSIMPPYLAVYVWKRTA